MIKNHLTNILLGLVAAAMLAACDSYSDDNWKPGEQVAAGVQGAFFSTDNATGFSVSDSTTFNIIISRVDSTEAATVPINVVSRDTAAIEIPSSVSFEAGKGTATLTCSAEGLAEDSLYSFTIAVGDSQVNPYAAGSSTYTGTVINGALWITVVKDAPTYFYYNGSYTYDFTYKTTIKQYLTTNYFYIEDFLNSGSGFSFRITDDDGNYQETIEDINTVTGTITGLENEGVYIEDYGTFSYNYFYTFDESGTSTYSWTDSIHGITWEYFLFYSKSDYAVFHGADRYAEMTGYCCFTSGAKSQFSTLYIDWR